jgi:hypothetical protein
MKKCRIAELLNKLAPPGEVILFFYRFQQAW